ncbi:hypothetical protein P691DRAFT_803794 [Macrolepiota fuliginosa MF-IS2]|uniref:Uncharacterized protein n=1 Tax=Macrolepiota fuliginosa MF-IS2 TaxID=1400762 RepID=A0A9P6C599_9AGAR|nr:hypothetical protein P691DRAFT_803794 [Macrolepiota fuliginosa MF-IS2]
MAEAASSSIPSTTTPFTSPNLESPTEGDMMKAPKRRTNTLSDYDFFAPAASSFHPRPYAPHSHLSDSRIKPFQFSRNQGRSHDALVVPAGMDPHPSDPNVIFIHPPFTTFPGSDCHPDGLSFQVMADNPEWFLDPKDFVHENNANPHAISYPPILEPPRGWCPAKKKDLKERGTEGWIKGEEPRLRCTFCRRHYAGVNAKSMWRRHVFEKHKIAMANRRDGADRPRGRSSNKENKQIASRNREDGHDTLVNLKLEVIPGTDPQNISHKSKFRSSAGTESSSCSHELSSQDENTSSSVSALEPKVPTSNRQTSTGPSTSPPLTPHSSSDAGNVSIESSDGVPPTPPSSVPLIPPSPYNPLLTPSFRHSPPRLPSDQPWRFPSPSHPLHSQSRDLSLSMLVRNAASPLVKGLSVLGGSPLVYPPSTSSSSRFVRPETPLSGIRLPLSSSNQARFTRNRIGSSPLANRVDLNRSRHRIEESPLSRAPSRPHKRSCSGLTDDWYSEALLPNQLSDPFSSIFSSGGAERQSPLKRALETESPILRSRNSTDTKGLGIGLLEPFNLTKKTATDDEGDINDMLDSSSSFGDLQELDDIRDSENLETELEPQRSPSSPPAKRRRLDP